MFSFSFIRDRRLDTGLSQEQLATLTALDSAYLSRLEQNSLKKDDPLPTVGMLQRLHTVLNG